MWNARKTFWYTFRDVTVPSIRKAIHTIVTKFRQSESLPDENEPDQNVVGSLKRNWTISVPGLNIIPKNPSRILHRRAGFKVSDILVTVSLVLKLFCWKWNVECQVCSISKKELQHMNLNILRKCKGCVRNNRGHFEPMVWFVCDLLACGLAGSAAGPNAHCTERFDARGLCLFRWIGPPTCGRLSNNLSLYLYQIVWILTKTKLILEI
jgi:hypothetical protein